MEDALDQKTATLIRLQKVAMEVNAGTEDNNPKLLEALGCWAADKQQQLSRDQGVHTPESDSSLQRRPDNNQQNRHEQQIHRQSDIDEPQPDRHQTDSESDVDKPDHPSAEKNPAQERVEHLKKEVKHDKMCQDCFID